MQGIISIEERLSRAVVKYGETALADALLWRFMASGEELFQQGNFERAIVEYEKAYSLLSGELGFPETGNEYAPFVVMMMLAGAYSRVGKVSVALHFFKRTFEVNPDMEDDALDAVIEYVGRHGSSEEIVEFCEFVLSNRPKNREAAFLLEIQLVFPRVVGEIGATLAKVSGESNKQVAIATMSLWGKEYAENFLETGLPSLLANGNLPSISNKYNLVLQIYIDTLAYDVLDKAGVFDVLQGYASVDIVKIEGIVKGPIDEKIQRMQLFSFGHYATLEAARVFGADVFFLFPDNVINSNFLSHAADTLEKGFAVVLVPGLRLVYGEVIEYLRGKTSKSGVLNISASESAKLAYENLPDNWYCDSNYFTPYPFFLCWRYGQSGLHFRASHMQPYAIRAGSLEQVLVARIDPLDGDFLYKNVGNHEEIHVVTDGEMLPLDVGNAPMIGSPELIERRFSPELYARFVQEYDNPVRRWLLSKPINLECSSEDEKLKLEAQSLADNVVQDVFGKIDVWNQMLPNRHLWSDIEDKRNL